MFFKPPIRSSHFCLRRECGPLRKPHFNWFTVFSRLNTPGVYLTPAVYLSPMFTKQGLLFIIFDKHVYIPQISTWGAYFQLHLRDPAFIRYPALNRENTVFTIPILTLFTTLIGLGDCPDLYFETASMWFASPPLPPHKYRLAIYCYFWSIFWTREANTPTC